MCIDRPGVRGVFFANFISIRVFGCFDLLCILTCILSFLQSSRVYILFCGTFLRCLVFLLYSFLRSFCIIEAMVLIWAVLPQTWHIVGNSHVSKKSKST